jgi:hypothetical protein
MSEDTKAAKAKRCRELLEANPDLGMKEANVTIREEFGTGVAPTTFSKIKKELSGESTASSTSEKSASPEKAQVAPSDSAESSPSETNTSEESEQSSEKTEEKKDSADKKKQQEKSEGEASQQEETPPVVEEEEEIDPNLPKFPVHLEILVPTASTVHLSGSFNRWRIDELPMTNSGEGFWVFDGELPQGEWHYKFVVDGRLWYLDIHKRKVTDRTGVSHPIQVGDPIPKEETAEDLPTEEGSALPSS